MIQRNSEKAKSGPFFPAHQEVTPAGTWIIGSDGRGRWIGQSAGERFSRGQDVTMTFSMQDAYWFDHATGRTLAAP